MHAHFIRRPWRARRKALLVLAAALGSVLVLESSTVQAQGGQRPSARQAKEQTVLFEANRGQADPRVRYVAAIDYAEKGFPVRPSTVRAIQNQQPLFARFPDNQKYWSKPDGSQYVAGETVKLPTLAKTLRRMVEAERKAKKKGRRAGIIAARDRFYKGDIAREMVAFLKNHDAPWELDDFAEFFARVEEPAKTSYRGYEVYKQSFGSQGPVLLETLNMLEQFDLKSMKHNSADYLHTLVEALKLGYADRDTYYGDPQFVQVPGEGLLSKSYARERARLIDPVATAAIRAPRPDARGSIRFGPASARASG